MATREAALADDLLKLAQSTRELQRVAESLSAGHRCSVGGLWGSGCALAVAALARETAATLLVLTPTSEQAEALQDDLATFLPQGVALFPARETLRSEEKFTDGASAARLELLKHFRAGASADSHAPRAPRVIVAPVQAALQPVQSPQRLQADTLELRAGQSRALDQIAEWLVARGFERLPQIEAPGEFAIRGGILDIYPPAVQNPVRIEFLGDRMESMREFDVATQRSVRTVDAYEVVAGGSPKRERSAHSPEAASLLSYLPRNMWLILREPLDVQQRAEALQQSAELPDPYLSLAELLHEAADRPILEATALPPPTGADAVDFNWQSAQRVSGDLATLTGELMAVARECARVIVYCNNPGEQQRLVELLGTTPLGEESKLEYRIGHLAEGFRIPSLRLAVLAHHEMFRRYRRRRTASPRRRGAPIESFIELEKGDYVVHIAHGIARYMGTDTLQKDGATEEFLLLQFAEGTKLYVPATRITLVQKYIGSAGSRPALSKLGGTAWQKRKHAVKESLKDLAMELLDVQALREKMSGIAFPDDTEWQHEFEAAFLYEETEDQLAVNGEIKRSMRSARPMDRLICGDVGYGKTELAMRAAFKAVLFGKQVAVLVPTTVLCEQHYRTFTERMADYPVRTEAISRFKTPAEQRDVLAQTADGRIDILIGTHRLLGRDVAFKDLGLVIIDEEQRFGVRHKEQLKKLRALVDVLTMTATPIPRTLHMSLMGLKDISTLDTPPPDRLAIHTEVCRWDDASIREACLREMNRGGQIFFVHNRVFNIEQVAADLRQVVPEARITIGHGQMPEHQLERNMKAFIEGHYDVLLCTTIIESGLDIPNVNTIFVNRADDFGLADLHQLRGRVGRYKHRAYAYFLIPRNRPIAPKAFRRLKAIEEFHELGAGFKIALRDLEIRGAGNILGVEQHGHIVAVGYDLYCKLLDMAVREIKGETIPPEPEITIDFGLDAYLPADYIADEMQRMEMYRKIARAVNLNEIESVYFELKDRFGEPPRPAVDLLTRETLRVFATPLAVKYLGLRKRYVLGKFATLEKIEHAFGALRNKVRIVDNETMHILLPPNMQTPEQAMTYLMGLFQNRPSAKMPAALTAGDG